MSAQAKSKVHQPLAAVTVEKKVKAGRCITPFCRRKARNSRHVCCTCQDRIWRANNPMRYLLKNLRGHAKQRGISFTITYEQWSAFCLKTGYHEAVGTAPCSATVDRIDSRFGYHADNIRVLSHAENSKRQNALPTPADDAYETPWARCG